MGIIAAGLAAVVIVVSLLTVDLAKVVAARAQLAAAADAAALAAAPTTFSDFGGGQSPWHAASEMAVANGVDLTSCSCTIDRSWAPRGVLVTVRLAGPLTLLSDRVLNAVAAAEFQPIALVQR